jgi:hypothetical protein
MNKRNSIILGAVLLLLSGAALAHDTLKQRVSWAPETLNLPSLKPGESTTTSVVLTNASLLKNQKINGEHLAFQITNPNGANITATAKFPKKFEPGEKVTVTLVVSVASSTPALPPRVIAGKVQLIKKDDDDKGKKEKEKGKENDEVKMFEKPLTVNIAVSSIPLPPFPNKAEDAKTILGLDVDANGVPDRVEWFIAKTAPDSEKKRAAMTLSAKAQQDFFKDFLAHLGEDPNDAGVIARVRGMADESNRISDCLKYVYGVRPGFSVDDESWKTYRQISSELQAKFMDSPERMRASWQSEKPLVATSGPDIQPEQYKQQCLDLGFNPDQLPN